MKWWEPKALQKALRQFGMERTLRQCERILRTAAAEEARDHRAALQARRERIEQMRFEQARATPEEVESGFAKLREMLAGGNDARG